MAGKAALPGYYIFASENGFVFKILRMAQEIYAEYTDLREPFGCDESWLDVTASATLKGDGELIAKEISNRMKSELGITVSIGVLYKIFAKLVGLQKAGCHYNHVSE